MLGVFPDSAPDSVDKSLKLAQPLAKEDLKSLTVNTDVSLVFYLTLVLLPSEQSGIFQKNSRKRNFVQACGTGGGKVIFALLEEIVTLQVSITLINVWEPSFQRLLTWTFIVRSGGNNGSQNRCWRSRIQNGSEDLLEIILQVSNHGGVVGAKSSKRSNNRCSSGSKSTCCGGSRGATLATLGKDSASELVFAVVKILARTAMSEQSSHQTG